METINKLQTAGLEPLHFILAYAGMILNLLIKAGEQYPVEELVLKKFLTKYLFSILFSLIAIPVILIVATDTSIREFLPINLVTAVLAGWQTQAIFKSTFVFVANRRGLNKVGANGTSDTPPSTQ